VERRAQSRQPFRCEVKLLGENLAPALLAVISDLSLSGCYVETQTPLPAGTRMQLLFKLPEQPFALLGKVRHVHPQMGMGVEFLKLSPGELASLHRVVGENER
jgi:hypothetical protein